MRGLYWFLVWTWHEARIAGALTRVRRVCGAAGVILIFAISLSAQKKPDWRENIIPASQEHPVCAVQVMGRWEFYRCGAATEAQRDREARSTVWVQGLTKLDHPTVDKKFILVNFAAGVMATADLWSAQRAIHRGAGREGNPLLGQHAVVGGIVMGASLGASIWSEFKLKRNQAINRQVGIARSVGWWTHLPWWFPAAVQMGVHAVGLSSSLRARR